jgi:transcriptional regulator with GAF, ATPase, and Fis domain
MEPLHPGDAASFAQLAGELRSEPTTAETLHRVVELAVRTVPGCDYAGITMTHPDRMEAPASTDPLVEVLNLAQHELRQGPCLDTARTEHLHLIRDTSADTRWPAWSQQASAAGVNSVMSVKLDVPKRVAGALNLYSKALDAYDEDTVVTAQIFAAHVTHAVNSVNKVQGLMTAMQTRHQIGMAQGMLRMRYGLTEEQAFAFLARLSQAENIKLRDVANRIVDELAGHTWPGSGPNPLA